MYGLTQLNLKLKKAQVAVYIQNEGEVFRGNKQKFSWFNEYIEEKDFLMLTLFIFC